MKYLITGLGNIGAEYELTRHNIGFLVVDQLAEKFKVTFRNTRLADKAEFKHKGRTFHLIKPTTYMNLSGKSIQYWLTELKLSQNNLLVIVDDIALPFGSLRMRAKGSSAGHNGLNHIEQTLSNPNYPRLRFGIGNDYGKGQQIDYVLSRFSESEFKELPEYLDKACQMILSFGTIGIQRTMNQFND